MIAFCWGIVALAWVTGMVVAGLRGPRTVRRGGTWEWVGAAILVALFALSPASFWAAARFGRPWLRDGGAVLLVVTTAFTLWARWVLGTMWSSTAVVKQGHRLRTAGPYAVTRHPVYTGLLGMVLGTALMLGTGKLLGVFAAGVVYLELKIHAEERLMVETFGAEYAGYRRRVPQLVPGLLALWRLMRRR